jgi:hypothetical protein
VVEAGIIPADRADTWYQADLAVTCAPAERGARALAEPRLIIEVLFPSTAAHDRGVKLADYRKLASVELLLVASEDRHVGLAARRGRLARPGPDRRRGAPARARPCRSPRSTTPWRCKGPVNRVSIH